MCRVTQLSNWGEEAITGSSSGSEKAELEMEFKKVVEEYRHCEYYDHGRNISGMTEPLI